MKPLMDYARQMVQKYPDKISSIADVVMLASDEIEDGELESLEVEHGIESIKQLCNESI
jgi:hypothetical protein